MAQTTLDFRDSILPHDDRVPEFVGLDLQEILTFHLNMVAGHARSLPRTNPMDLGSYPSSDEWTF
jgi:hypothetical protein